MAWIESHQELRNHPKSKRLARLLDVSRYEAVGILQWLWWWALDYAPDGDISRFTDDDVEDGIDWTGAPGALMAALREAGFIDEHFIHDWDEYAGRLVAQREANRERKRVARAKDVTSAGRPRDGQGTGRAVTALPTQPTQPTEQNTTQPTEPSAASARFDLREIEQLWFQATGNTIPPRQIEVIEATVHAHGPPAVKRAIEVAGLNNARDWRYVQACLDRWAKGVTSGKPERKAREHTLPRAPDLIVE